MQISQGRPSAAITDLRGDGKFYSSCSQFRYLSYLSSRYLVWDTGWQPNNVIKGDGMSANCTECPLSIIALADGWSYKL